MVKETSDAALIDFPIPDLALEVHRGGIPGAPGAILLLSKCLSNLFLFYQPLL